MSAGDYSRRIEALLRKLHGPFYRKSDEILINPYEEIISALECRVSKEKLDRFKLCYQAISGQTLQELIDDNYDVERLIIDLIELTNNDI